MHDTLMHIEKSPLLECCPESLPARWYRDPEHFELEMKSIHRRQWNYVGRANDIEKMMVRRVTVAGQELILVKNHDGDIACFHNVCRHRGAELCAAAETRLKSKLITCPYHEWSYDLAGHLVRTPHATPTADFNKQDHGLLAVQVKLWNGFVFVCLADEAPDFDKVPDHGIHALDNWPMDALVTGHSWTEEIACNWKVFWENYNECLHCPGIHPELCDMVPIYKHGVMAANELPQGPPSVAGLKPGAVTWTANGKPCGAVFPRLSADERARGHTFITLMPTLYVVAHVDYVRAVSLRPLGPERTELRAEWLFSRETFEAPDFNLANVTEFATTVMRQDAVACEINQRGLRSPAFKSGRLMPQEFDVYNFQQWVRAAVAEGKVDHA